MTDNPVFFVFYVFCMFCTFVFQYFFMREGGRKAVNVTDTSAIFASEKHFLPKLPEQLLEG